MNLLLNCCILVFIDHLSGSMRTYVDPHAYEDPGLAVRQFTREIEPSDITIDSILGKEKNEKKHSDKVKGSQTERWENGRRKQ